MSTAAIKYLSERFSETIDYARKEYDVTYEEVVGTLVIMAFSLFAERKEIDEEKDGD